MLKKEGFKKKYDLAIIGAGPGGYHAAIRAAQYGAKVALIEKNKLGGTCLNRGCIPTKALLASAHYFEKLHDAEELGIVITDYNIDFSKVVERKNRIVDELGTGIANLQKSWKNDVYLGHGKILGGNVEIGFEVLIQGVNKIEKIIAKRVIIATGSTPALIPNFNVDHEKILTSDDILDPNFKIIPESLLIIGAGVIGCEFADIFANFGSQVTLLEYLPTPIAGEEPVIIKELKKKFDKMGIKIVTSQNVLSVENTGSNVKAITCSNSIPANEIEHVEEFTYESDYCLISIGRNKLSKDLGLENLDIKTRRGTIEVDHATLETSAKGVYAIGDVTGGLMLAHVASYEGNIAVLNALSSLEQFQVKPMRTNYRVVPSTIFTSPNIGTVGLKRKQAKNLGIDLLVGQFPYESLGKAKCLGENGLLVILADKYTLQIVGASCIGEGAAELIAEITLAMQNGLSIEDITDTIHSHPTLSEMVLEAAEAVVGRAIHKKGRPIDHGLKDILIEQLMYGGEFEKPKIIKIK
ncbi:MAG: dihydrolipoyl dehydrogenase [Candidatus Lokiarchaeota archaeon]|nr:dihydrolipoyl dehydrogenase [Candidatus Lokiarchaeota archaeon]